MWSFPLNNKTINAAKMSPPAMPLPQLLECSRLLGAIHIFYNHFNSQWLENNFLCEKEMEKGLLLITKFKKKLSVVYHNIQTFQEFRYWQICKSFTNGSLNLTGLCFCQWGCSFLEAPFKYKLNKGLNTIKDRIYLEKSFLVRMAFIQLCPAPSHFSAEFWFWHLLGVWRTARALGGNKI